MWKPPERIRFDARPGHWPTADEAEGAKLFTPVKTGPVTLHERTWVPAMVPWRATNEGFVTPEVLAWYRRFAEGQPGAIVVEATGVRDVPSGPLLRIGNDRFLPGLKDLVDTVREASGGKTKLFIQIIDFLSIRRRPDPDKYFDRFLEISDELRDRLEGQEKGAGSWDEQTIRDHLKSLSDEDLEKVLDERQLESLRQGYRERVTDMDLPHVRDLPTTLPDLFAAAAGRARDAGFDGVELHYAHAYTMASFLSAKNNRPDGYGGPKENRVKLPIEVYQRVREAVGNDIAVGCRFLADECIDGGSTVEDAIYYGTEFARAGMDFLSTSRGGKFDDAAQPKVGWAAYPYTGPSGYECMPQYISDEKGPFGRNVEATARIHDAIRSEGFKTPVVVTGGIHNFDQAEGLLQDGKADIIGMARQMMADPDWPRKVRSGHGEAVRLCEYTNYCEGLDQKHKQVTCKLWDRLDLDEPDVMLSDDGKRRLNAPRWEK
jgi:2,4-dienoyl-CoA reductase-like NADH-dependent reductase (Old Yellow Enzyme family)